MRRYDAKNLCTCSDTRCPFNPVNHDQGCTPCIAKNLAAGEIPSCFFNALDMSEKPSGYRMEDFAECVMRTRSIKRSADSPPQAAAETPSDSR